jgi:hypothetical protein
MTISSSKFRKSSRSSKIEGKLVEVNIRWNVADLAAIDGDLIGEHARSGDLDGVWPVVVVVAQSIGEVQDCFLGDERCVLCNVEVGWFHGALGDSVGNEEEVESAFDNLSLLDEAVINVGTLRRVEDVSLVTAVSLLEESLSDSLVDDDESDVRDRFTL